MTLLRLGVIDIPYSTPAAEGKANKPAAVSVGVQTTGSVAEMLEKKYHIFEIFFEEHREDIAKSLEESLSGAIESLAMGAPSGIDPFGAATSGLDAAFKKFLTSREMESLGYPGVPTKAALMGVNHRMKRKRGPRRPSFIDTGMYENSFKAWIE